MIRRERLVSVSSVLVGFTLSLPASSQVATLARDIEPGHRLEGPGTSSSPRSIRAFNGKAIFFADQSSLGGELWASDGTATGTELLADSTPGAGNTGPILGEIGGLLYWYSFPGLWATDGSAAGTLQLNDPSVTVDGSAPVIAGNRVFFTGRTTTGSWGLYTSEGTAASTDLVSVLDPTDQGLPPQQLTSSGTRVFFVQPRSSNEVEVWTSDGSTAGTRVVRSLSGSPVRIVSSSSAGNLFFFVVRTGGNREELWTSNGEVAGTRLLLAPNLDSPEFRLIEASGQRLLFTFTDAVHGRELWATDGSTLGTRRLSNLPDDLSFPLASSTNASFYVETLGNSILFIAGSPQAGHSLWRTDGDPAQTRQVATVCATCGATPPPSHLLLVGSQIYFVGRDSAHGEELWVSNGTTAGTRLVTDLCPGTCGGFVGSLKAIGEELYFLGAEDGGTNRQLWRTNGQTAGTRRLTNLPGNHPLGSGQFERVGNQLFFAAEDDLHGLELWVSEGTPESARLVTDIARAGVDAFPLALTALNEQLLFRRCGGADAIWRSQGSNNTTLVLRDDAAVACRGNQQPRIFSTAGSAFFLAGNSQQNLWTSDGTTNGTLQVTSFSPSVLLDNSHLLGRAGGRFLFSIQGVQGYELWASDGTVDGTELAVSFTGEPIGKPTLFASVGDKVYFVASTSVNAAGLFVSDGTQAGTRKLTQALDYPSGSPSNLQFSALGDRVYFFAFEPSGGGDPDNLALWTTDNTAAGTEVVKILGPSTTGSEPDATGVLDDHLYFFTRSSDSGQQVLWKSDGTGAGTEVVTEINSELGPSRIVSMSGAMYFALTDVLAGYELWRSDGSAAGTALLVDLLPGTNSSQIDELVATNSRLFFVATTLRFGRELWVSDGSVQGTRLVHDLAPGPASSNPQELTVVGNRLYFSADDGVHGRELWSLDLTINPITCPPSDSGLCLQNNRFRVEIDWRDFLGNTGRGTPVPLTADTGYFWFFNPANVETIVKVLDGRPINEHFWTFYGALSNVEYTMTVTDAQTGLAQRYFNPSRQFASVGDTESFGPNGASLASFTAPNELLFQSHEPIIDSLFDSAKAGSCAPSSTRLCLNNGRFAVEATWKDFQNRTGVGMAQPLTGDTGYFWFFRDSNVEVVTKVLDGRPVNGKFWVFYGALSNVEYTLTVTDTETGAIKTYFNPSRRFGSVGDTAAF